MPIFKLCSKIIETFQILKFKCHIWQLVEVLDSG